jgi:hypothetical protein
VLQEPRQQHLVEVRVLHADDVLVGAAQPLPVQHRVAGRDVQRTGDAGSGLLDAGDQGLRLRQQPPAAHLLGEGGGATGCGPRSGDERAAAGDPLEQTFRDQGVERLPHGHPGDAEAGDQLALGRCHRPRRLLLDEAADVLTHLDVLERPLARHDDVQLVHVAEARSPFRARHDNWASPANP